MAKNNFVFDSFAVLCFLEDENGAEEVHELLDLAARDGCHIKMNVVNLAEVLYTVQRREGEQQASEVLSLLESFPITIEIVDKQHALVAADFKSRFAIALGDCFCVASAKSDSATVVTGDPEFKAVQGEIGIKWLPSKPKQRKPS